MMKNLEQRVGNPKVSADDKSKMNGGERFIANILENEKIKYTYEPRLCTEDTYKNKKGVEKSYLRLNYPDFSLPDHGLFIEYIGRPDDPEYMEKLRFKMKKYEEMGIPVLYIHRDEIYKKIGENNFVKREDAYENIRQLIRYMTRGIKSSGTKPASINAEMFKDYDYKSKAA
jgi:hypothetical protein